MTTMSDCPRPWSERATRARTMIMIQAYGTLGQNGVVMSHGRRLEPQISVDASRAVDEMQSQCRKTKG